MYHSSPLTTLENLILWAQSLTDKALREAKTTDAYRDRDHRRHVLGLLSELQNAPSLPTLARLDETIEDLELMSDADRRLVPASPQTKDRIHDEASQIFQILHSEKGWRIVSLVVALEQARDAWRHVWHYGGRDS